MEGLGRDGGYISSITFVILKEKTGMFSQFDGMSLAGFLDNVCFCFYFWKEGTGSQNQSLQ